MQIFKGIQTLIAAVGSLPDCGFLYITGNSDTDTPTGLQSCTFLLPDTEEDELFIEDNSDYNSWLEAPTFSDIIENYTSKHPNASEADLIRAVLHYWEKDDFLD